MITEFEVNKSYTFNTNDIDSNLLSSIGSFFFTFCNETEIESVTPEKIHLTGLPLTKTINGVLYKLMEISHNTNDSFLTAGYYNDDGDYLGDSLLDDITISFQLIATNNLQNMNSALASITNYKTINIVKNLIGCTLVNAAETLPISESFNFNSNVNPLSAYYNIFTNVEIKSSWSNDEEDYEQDLTSGFHYDNTQSYIDLTNIWGDTLTITINALSRENMVVQLMSTSNEKNVVQKNVTLVESLFGVLKERCSLVNPVITIEKGEHDFNEYNYVYLPNFARYYFIEDIIIINNKLRELHLHVDVLKTYASKIGQQTGYIDRNENSYNPKIVDKNVILENEPEYEFVTGTQAIQFITEDSGYTNKIVIDVTEG